MRTKVSRSIVVVGVQGHFGHPNRLVQRRGLPQLVDADLDDVCQVDIQVVFIIIKTLRSGRFPSGLARPR